MSSRQITVNRRALRDYHVLERVEAGIELRGTEVKSIRLGHVSMIGAYARVEKGEAWLLGLNISPYDHGNQFNHDPERPRRLLLHKQEIHKLQAQAEQKGLALVPLAMNFRRGRVKVEIGVCRGKQAHDKRETIKRRTADREAARAMRQR
ncbi:MAG: SsrA-binding protein SmpB [Kiritimatiellae bacterium]|nr:SsrA-binding protein SmpB [Kiritimatiellia bacterium]